MRDEANILINKALQDLAVLELLGVNDNYLDSVFGFHSQQAIEKALKAVIFSTGNTYPYSHNIALLIDILKKAGVKSIPEIDEPGMITVFAVEYRYDSYDEYEPVIDRNKLLDQVKTVLEWAEKTVK